MPKNTNTPFAFEILHGEEILLSDPDTHIVRHLSSMKGQYLDQDAFEARLAVEDSLLYEVYEVIRPATEGELLQGISILHPGKVGNEYAMTKGHFHSVIDNAEVYYCLRGEGFLVMETPEGEWAVETMGPNKVIYVPPRWAHRSVNTSDSEDLVTFFVYPGNSGHDYGSIEKQGFRKLIVEQDGVPAIVNNPRWMPPEDRK